MVCILPALLRPTGAAWSLPRAFPPPPHLIFGPCPCPCLPLPASRPPPSWPILSPRLSISKHQPPPPEPSR
ncbi:hypothetical protein L209DRAFT_747050 [Thermothelomyces heterothallicus CBS 203.75]